MASLPNDSNHHYVPEFYLKGFTERKHTLWVYEKGLSCPRSSTPRQEGSIRNYYRFDDIGVPDDSVEKMLGKAESLVSPIIRKLSNPQFQMTNKQRSTLYTFVALTFVRVPAYRNFIDEEAEKHFSRFVQNVASERERFHRKVDQFEQQTGESLGDREEAREQILSGKFRLRQESAGFNIFHSLKSGLDIADTLEKEFGYDIFYCEPGAFFITCDNPVFTLGPQANGTATLGMGFGLPDTEILFPLNKRACLKLSRNAEGSKLNFNLRQVDQLNVMVMAAAQKCAYAPGRSELLSKSFEKYGCGLKYGSNAFLK